MNDGMDIPAHHQMSEQKIESFSALVWRRFKKHHLAVFSLLVLIFLFLLSAFASILESCLQVSHDVANLALINHPFSWPHLLGTNELGQDVFSRLIFGGRISLSVGIISALSSALIGTVIGLIAGYFGGIIDLLLMRFTDAMLSIPVLPLMIVFAALDLNSLFVYDFNLSKGFLLGLVTFSIVLCLKFASYSRKSAKRPDFTALVGDALIIGCVSCALYLVFFNLFPWRTITSGSLGSVVKLILIIVLFGWMTVARLVRAATLQLKNMEFIIATRALGASNWRIVLAHILPNALAPVIVAATLEVGDNILYEAALSFLGLGIQPPVSSWGNMLNNAIEYIKTYPMLAFWPGFCILITVACFNFLGDGLRDALDPHQIIKSNE